MNLLKRWRQKDISQSEFEWVLVEFLERVKQPQLANFLENCDFDMLPLAERLKVVRLLLEAQLTRNKHVIEYCHRSSAEILRHEPLGRDINGSYYWRFDDTVGGGYTILKELADGDWLPLCAHIRYSSQLGPVIRDIRNIRTKKYCAGAKCSSIGRKSINSAKCSQCKTLWHRECIDPQLHFDQEDWLCPACDQKSLIAHLQSYLPEE